LRIEHGGLEGNVYASLHTTTLQDLETTVERGRIPPLWGGGAEIGAAPANAKTGHITLKFELFNPIKY